MGSLLTKTSPPGGQVSQPTPDQPSENDEEDKDVTSPVPAETVTGDVIDPTKTVTSETGDVTGQGDTGSGDTTEAAPATSTTDDVNKADADTLPEPREETAPDTHVTESPPDVATKVTDERGATNESPSVTADVSHDSPTQIQESPADAAICRVEQSESASSDAEQLTDPERSTSTDVTQVNEDNGPENQHQANDNSLDEQHSIPGIEQQLEDLNLAPIDSLQEM